MQRKSVLLRGCNDKNSFGELMNNSPNTFGQWSGACVSRLIQLKELMRITLFWVTMISTLSALVTDISRTLDTETVVSLPDIWKLELILLGHGNMSPRILASRNIASQDMASQNMASRNMASWNMDSRNWPQEIWSHGIWPYEIWPLLCQYRNNCVNVMEIWPREIWSHGLWPH